MQSDTLNEIIRRAKVRKDGFYTYGCIDYNVKNGNVQFFVDFDTAFQFCYGFTVQLGKKKDTQSRRDFLKYIVKKGAE